MRGSSVVRLNCLPMSEKDRSPLWGGRFGTTPAEAFERLNASIPFDERLAPYDIRGSVAHARMLGERGMVSAEEAADLERGLRAVLEEVELQATSARGEGAVRWRRFTTTPARGGRIVVARRAAAA